MNFKFGRNYLTEGITRYILYVTMNEIDRQQKNARLSGCSMKKLLKAYNKRGHNFHQKLKHIRFFSRAVNIWPKNPKRQIVKILIAAYSYVAKYGMLQK